MSAAAEAPTLTAGEADALAERAEQAYKEKNYPAAIGALEEAYRGQPKPWYLHNLGYAHERRGAKAQALQCFEEFLSTAQEVPQEVRARVSERMRALRQSPKVPLSRRWWFWTAIGVAAAGAVAGITAGVLLSTRKQAPCIQCFPY